MISCCEWLPAARNLVGLGAIRPELDSIRLGVDQVLAERPSPWGVRPEAVVVEVDFYDPTTDDVGILTRDTCPGDRVRRQTFSATRIAPKAIMATPAQFRAASFSPKNTAAKRATRTTLSLSIGATCAA